MSGLPFIYVGQTGIPINERFQQHLDGYKSSRKVRELGVRLRPELYEFIDPMNSDESDKAEERLSKLVSNWGYIGYFDGKRFELDPSKAKLKKISGRRFSKTHHVFDAVVSELQASVPASTPIQEIANHLSGHDSNLNTESESWARFAHVETKMILARLRELSD
ncbi:MAG: hypothetical protein ACPGYP_04685 [Solirubrobacterales bacterium]